MANIHAEMLTADEVRTIAAPILADHFAAYGFSGVVVSEAEELDGSHVFRMTADVTRRVPAKILVDALDAIHRKLRRKGEDRFVFLSTHRPGEDEVDEDAE
jgi:hypothetical protein